MATNNALNNQCLSDFSVTRSESGGTVTLNVINGSNTAGSNSRQLIQVAGTSANDPFTSWSISGSTIWSAGLDQSASSAWKLSQASTLGTNDVLSVTTAGAVSVVLGNLDVTRADVGGNVQITVSNTNNSNSASNAILQTTVGGTSAGSPMHVFTVTGSDSWTIGADVGDSNKFKIAPAAALLSTNTSMVMTVAGYQTLPKQAAFLAFSSSTQSNVTGAGATVTVVFGNEIFDQNSNYNPATGVYTAPITARHRFSTNVLISDAAGTTHGQLAISTSNRAYLAPIYLVISGLIGCGGEALADMDAGDVASITANAYGAGGNTADIDGTGGQTYFCGNIEC